LSADVSLPSSRGPNSSIGTAALKYEHWTGLPTTIRTGVHSVEVLGVGLGFEALMKIDPVPGGGPLFAIDMPRGAVLEASWGNDRRIVFRTMNGTASDGIFRVRHSLTPEVDLYVYAFSQEMKFPFSALSLLNAMPGANFAYDSAGQAPFTPWGFQGADVALNNPNMDDAELFSVGFDKFPDIVADKLEGDLSLRATTKPKFTFDMTRVVLQGAANAEIASQGGEAVINAIDGDYLDMNVTAFGQVTAAGDLKVRPHIMLTKAFFDLPITVNVDIPMGPSIQYTTEPVSVAFQNVIVHIPLPNVHVPRRGVDLGQVKADASATKMVTIENSGEMAASVHFESTDAQFTVPGHTVTIEPKGTYELPVKVSPKNSGSASADIRVLSNDPDSPEQTFRVGANGAEVGDEDDDGSSGASGCGCKTAGADPAASFAGFGLFGFGAFLFARRRRRAR
jgi:MYXO-CTERM domain-containing protein